MNQEQTITGPNAMRAYHNDPAIKAKYVARFAAHRAADEVIQGTGFEEGRGCFIGCTLDKYEPKAFPAELGMPVWLAHLADRVFEGLPEDEAPQFGTDILEVVHVGADLEPARDIFLINVQQRNLARLAGNTEPYAQECRDSIQAVIDYLSRGAEIMPWAHEAVQRVALSAQAAAQAAEDAWWVVHLGELTSAASASLAASVAEEAALSAFAATAATAAQSSQRAQRAAAFAARGEMSATMAKAREEETQKQRDDLLEILRGCGNV